MGYYDPPEDFICPVCKLEDCEGCDGWEAYTEEPHEIWEDDGDDYDGLSKLDYQEIEADIRMSGKTLTEELQEDIAFINKTYGPL
jgi:hypothetical protein